MNVQKCNIGCLESEITGVIWVCNFVGSPLKLGNKPRLLCNFALVKRIV